MSKRMGFQFRQPRSKMPKLDITISSSQRISVAGPSNMNQPRESMETPAHADDGWGDDEEDEIFVLASQAVEQVQANAAVVISQAMNNTVDVSYSRFRQNVRPVHSTQFNAIDEFDNDEDLFSNVPDYIPNAVQPPLTIENKENNAQSTVNQQNNQNSARMSSDNKAKEQKEKIQNEYYAEKVKAQKKQIEQLKETLNKLNQKCTTKEGEASTLRYEVDSKSREIERLRKERMNEAVDTEKKFSEKIAALEKKIETQRSELEFKNIEILQKKTRRSLNDSVVMETEGSAPNFELQHLFRLHANHISFTDQLDPSTAEFLTAKGLEKHRGISERDFDTLNSLNTLQSMYNGAKAKRLRQLDSTMMKEFIAIVNVFIEGLKIYTSRLTLRTPTKYNPATEYKLLSDEKSTTVTSNEADTPVTTTNLDEKLIFETQVLAVIALICTDFPNATHSVLFDKCEETETNSDEDDEMNGDNRSGSFVDILTDVLCTIGHSKTLSQHNGIIESASLLLVALARIYTPTAPADTVLLNLFQAIVFCEPDLSSLNHLSEFLSVVSENQSSNICNQFCTNESNNVMSIQRYKIHRFSIETCPLQVFSCLLQIAFQPYGSHKSQAKQTDEAIIVGNIIIRMLKFLRNCFVRRVDWLFRKNRNGDEAPQVSYCYCYVVSCIIVLLHFCINSWVENHKVFDLKFIKTISTMGAFFLYDIIKKHYEPKVLSLGGFPIKNRLQAIHDWIMSFHFVIRISSISENAIKSVNLRRIPQLNEPQMVSIELQQRSQDEPDSVLMNSFKDFLL